MTTSRIESPLQCLLEVNTDGMKVTDWAIENRESVEMRVKRDGVVVIRGLKLHSSKLFGQLLSILFDDELLEYTYRSTPRTAFKGNIYTATEYHSNQVIAQHNENAYANRWPQRIGFLCLVPSTSGGQTPIADSRAIYQSIPAEIRNEFERKGVKYIRNYSNVDLPWSEVFGSGDRRVIEAYCGQNDLQYQWLEDNALRTTQINPAVQVHPYHQVKVWFNQAHLFHVSSMGSKIAENLRQMLGESMLPRHCEFGDGTAIDPEYLSVIRQVNEMHKISFDWQKNDIMLLDNMLFTHGREAFEGQRKVLVGMARGMSK